MSVCCSLVLGGAGQHGLDVIVHLYVTGVRYVGVVPGVRTAVPVDEELLKVPRDVSDLHRFVEQSVGPGELCERWSARILHEGVNGDLVLPVHICLLEDVVKLGFEPVARPHVTDPVHQLFWCSIRLLFAELVAGVTEDNQVRVLLGECIYLEVRGLGQASVGGQVEDQHSLSFELVKGDSFILEHSCGVVPVDVLATVFLALDPKGFFGTGNPQKGPKEQQLPP